MRKERRFSREVLTRALERMCERLDEANRREVTFRNYWLRNEERAILRVTALWVFGSYARGVAECGDVDAIARVVVEEGRQPLDAPINRAFFRSPANVHTIFDPDPAECFARMSDESARRSAVLVWREREPSEKWRDRLADLAAAKRAARRYERDLDALPVRPEMLHPRTDLDEIIELCRQRFIKWEFHEFGEPTASETLTSDERKIEEEARDFGSAKLRRLLPYLFAHCRRHRAGERWSVERRPGRDVYHTGPAVVLTGRPPVPATLLDGTEYSALLIAPYLSGRGPNGVWTITRDVEHPLLKAMSLSSAFYFSSPDGKRETMTYGPDDPWKGAAVELFRTKEEARTYRMQRGERADAIATLELAHDGAAVLQLLHGADVVLTTDRDFALTRAGRRVLQRKNRQPEEFCPEIAELAEYFRDGERL